MPESQRAHTQKDLAHYFDPAAHNYHTETIALHKKWLAEVDPGEAILDVGAGSGIILEQLLRRPSLGSVLAIDISEAALQKGREINQDPRVRFENKSVYAIGESYPPASTARCSDSPSTTSSRRNPPWTTSPPP